MTPASVQPQIEEALRARRFGAARDLLAEGEPADIAGLIQDLEPSDRALVFRVLQRPVAADVFEYLTPEYQEELLKALAREDVAGILNEMAPDDRTALLEELPASATRHLMNLLTPAERQIARTLLGYPDDSIGRLMTPNYVAVRADWTVERALEHIRRFGDDSETLNTVYVVGEKGKLIDDIRIRQILLASADTKIAELCDGTFVALRARDDQESAIAQFREYDRVALPVTDSEGLLLGIVTHDDVLDVVEEEATEDIQKIGGTEALDEPYLETPLPELLRKRGVWLVVLFLGQMLTANVMGWFHAELASAIFLVLFLPLIISTGGNSGSQAATLVVRAMALGEVSPAHWWRVMRREILSGLALGAILGAMGFARVVAGAWLSETYPPEWPFIAIIVGVALIGVVIWGTLVGSMLPFVMRALGADPATSSTPFVTTVVDVSGVIIYLSLAMIVLRGTLP